MNSMLRMETLLKLMIMLLVINGFVPKWHINTLSTFYDLRVCPKVAF